MAGAPELQALTARLAGLALVAAWVTPMAPAAAEPDEIEQKARELEQRVAELSAVDPLQPRALTARLDHARLLQETAGEDCLQRLAAAEQQLAPFLTAGPEALLALPDGLPDATSLLQSIQTTRGQCARDEADARAAFQASITIGIRAVELLRENWDFEEMAIAQFNIAFARHELGDLPAALEDLEQVLAWDQEFGLRDELTGDYATLLRWREGGAEADPAAIERFVASRNRTKARFGFARKAHVARWTTLTERASLQGGRLVQVSASYDSKVESRRERNDWILVTSVEGTPRVDVSGATGTPADADRLQGLLAGLAGALPEMVIAADGSFKELRNLDAYRAALAAEIEQQMATALPPDKIAGTREAASRLLDAALSTESLTATAAGEWDIAVGAWIDGEFDHGDWYSTSFEDSLPGFSELPITKTFTFKVSRWLPCAPARRPDCVEVLVRIVPEPDQLAAAVADFVGRLMPAASREETEQAMRAVDYLFEARYRLVTEPDTLRPWSVEERKYLYAASIADGKRAVTARRERTLDTAQYPN